VARASVLVQRLTPADARELWELIDRNRRHLSRFGDDIAGNYLTFESVRDRIDKPPQGVWEYRCAIRDAETAQMVGFVKLTLLPHLYRVVEIGYWLGEEFTGLGYATKAVRFLTHLALTDPEFAYVQVRAWVHSDNLDSRKVLARAGYTEHGPDPDRDGLVRFSISPAGAENLS